MGLKLFFSYYIPSARAAYMVTKALNLPVHLKEVDIFNKSDDLLKVNPQHSVPTLQDGDFTIWDSHAICGYLVDQYSSSGELYPKDPKNRAIINQLLHLDTGELFPRLYNAVMPLLLGVSTVIPPVLCNKIYKSYDMLNLYLSKNEWIAGNKMTIADICCSATISTADYFVPVSKKRQKRLFKYLEKFQQLPYYEEVNMVGLDKLGQKVLETVTIAKNKKNIKGYKLMYHSNAM